MRVNKDLSPNLFIVGAAKAGTTSLYEYLIEHYDIFSLEKIERKIVYPYSSKEPWLFAADLIAKSEDEKTFRKWMIRDFATYMKLYSYSSGEKYRLDASVSYFYYSIIPERIKEYSPNAKIIISLRNPALGAYSMYTFMKFCMECQFENLSFEEVLKKEDEGMHFKAVPWGIRNNNLYYENLKRYIDVFGEKNVKVLIFEEWVSKTLEKLEDVCAFLDIEKICFKNIENVYNVSGIPKENFQVYFYKKIIHSQNILRNLYKKTLPVYIREYIINVLRKYLLEKNLQKVRMKEETKQELIEYYYEDIKKTEELLGRDLSCWYKD